MVVVSVQRMKMKMMAEVADLKLEYIFENCENVDRLGIGIEKRKRLRKEVERDQR